MQRPTTPPLYKAPPNVPFHTHLSTWSSPEINAFLTLQRCSHHAKVFEENDITGSVILELGADELKELGVIKVGERVRLLGAIRELKRRSVSSLASVSAKESSLGGSTPASASSFASAIQVQQQQHHQSHTRMTSSPKVYQGNLSEMSRRNNSQSSGIEFQLNGHNTPPMSYQSSGADWSTMSLEPEREGPSGTHGTSGLTRNRSGTGGSLRKLHAARPPPLHLHSSSHGHTGQNSLQASNNQNPANNSSSLSTPQPLPLSAVSEMGSNGSGSHTLLGTQPGSGSSAEWLVSTASAPNSRGLNGQPGQNAYPAGINGTGSNVPAPQGSSGRLRAPLPVSGSHGLATSNSLNYGRRSPSPALVGQGSQVNPTPLGRKGSNEYMARPLPGLPPLDDSNRMGDHEDFEGPVRKSSAGSIQSRIGGGSFGSTRSGGSDNTRPSTSSGALASQNTSTTHRRAGSSNMLSSFPSSSSKSPHPETRRSSNTRPSTTGSGSSVHPYAASQPRPIKEYSPTKASGSPTRSRFNTPSGSYESRGDITPTHPTSKWHGSGSSRSPHDEKGQKSWGTRWNNDKTGTPTLSLEDVKRKLVKFILVDDDTSRTIDVEACQNGYEVLEKALRKFGKWGGLARGGPPGLSESESETDEADCLDVDGWGVFLQKHDDARPLTEAELLAVCYAPPTDPARENGLYLKQMRVLSNRKNITNIFGDAPPPVDMSPTSPTYSVTTSRNRDSPRTANSMRVGKQTHRASMVSVMSALGVPVADSASKNAVVAPVAIPKSPSSGSFLATRGRKIHNFFGHRPPSEIISNHLAEYFPTAKRRDLEKGARNSMLRLGPKGELDFGLDAFAAPRLSLDGNRLPSRFSVASSNSSKRMSRASSHKNISIPTAEAIPEENGESSDVPRVSVSGDDGVESRPFIDGDTSGSSINGAPLLPAFQPSSESFSDSLKGYEPKTRPRSVMQDRRSSVMSTRSRLSTISAIRKNRRRSDAASLLTVDEITAEVENRRASVITFAESEEEAERSPDQFLAPGTVRLSKAYSPGLVPKEEGEDSEEEDSFEEVSEEEFSEEESDESEEEEEEEEEQHVKAVTSTGTNRSIKWIKGALIGQGSFGQVFLGMDAQNGLLMAVKQVNLDMGGTGSEERKQSMVTAMQREIALLKDLQHENIVQYLDSSTDQDNLNIFLEYVPGGSVTALLRNYGAFEELLVKNFVRQIVTGLDYLHGRNIIHRDIKGANILVDNKGGVKISDFGISKKITNKLASQVKLQRASLQGSVFWMAPEVVKQTAYTKKADIWSVGCLVVEMLTGDHPWGNLTQMQAIFKIGASAKPTIPSDISPEAEDFLQKMFIIEYEQRPQASELLEHAFLAKNEV